MTSIVIPHDENHRRRATTTPMENGSHYHCDGGGGGVGSSIGVVGKKIKTASSSMQLSSSILTTPTTASTAPGDGGGRRNGDDDGDCLSSLPYEVVCRVTSFLDAESLLRVRRLNRHYRRLASSSESGWEHLCRVLWKDKVHVLREAKLETSDRLRAYKISLLDAIDRNYVTADEFCYDEVTGKGTVWDFRFKESAGTDWTTVDPWYNGMPCRKMVFLRDGTVRQFVAPSSSSSSSPQQHQQLPTAAAAAAAPNGRLLAPPNFDAAQAPDQQQQQHQRQQQQQQHENNNAPDAAAAVAGEAPGNGGNNNVNGGLLVDPPMTMTWRFLTRPMDLPTRPLGSYVRLSVGGRDVPTYAVRRSPTGNWGFVMESCWGLYASFRLPPRQQQSTTAASTTTGQRQQQQQQQHATAATASRHERRRRRRPPQRRRLRRTEEGSMWIEVDDSSEDEINDAEGEEDNEQQGELDDDDDVEFDENHDNNARAGAAAVAQLQDDSSLLITNEVQWREAFLYNVGARVLPEGDEATDEFDRAWGGL